jgi:2-methylisocitrate lyase-like PEP mutase family enzyme
MGDGAVRLRRLLDGPGLVDAVGAHDVISAQLAAKAGFPVVYIGGAATAASNFGLPDIGLLPPDFFVDQARRVCSVVPCPVIVDLDDGGGNPLRVRRLVMLAEQAGVAGFHIEDTDMTGGKHFLGADGTDLDVSRDRMRPADEFAESVRAAVDARTDASMLVIARTDAPALTTLEDGLARARRYAEAGADMIFMRGVTVGDMEAVIGELPVPVTYMGLLDFTAEDAKRVESAGVKLLIRPNITRVVAFRAVADALAELKSTGEIRSFERPSYGETGRAVDSDQWGKLAVKYGM